jgi:hypothetical protein
VESRHVSLTFIAGHENENINQSIKYKLYKLDSKGTELEILALEANVTIKTQKFTTFSERLVCLYHTEVNRSTLVVNITGVIAEEDDGPYLLNMYYGDIIVLTKTTKLTVLQGKYQVMSTRQNSIEILHL